MPGLSRVGSILALDPMTMSKIIFRVIAVVVSLTIFCAIAYLPIYLWDSSLDSLNRTSQRDASHLNWLLGMTMIIWFPLVCLIAGAIASGAFYILWPRRKVTIGEIAARKGQRDGV